ncbi:hypothetical protein BBP40_003394 [Aspergillus hancockii]|nr:hypothetical protein BBP40_003394 [Aspergillus hancockii]
MVARRKSIDHIDETTGSGMGAHTTAPVHSDEEDLGNLDSDPVMNRKMCLVNDALDAIGWTPYHWKLFFLNGMGYGVDALQVSLQGIIATQAAYEFNPSYPKGLTIALCANPGTPPFTPCSKTNNGGWRYLMYAMGAFIFVMSIARLAVIRLRETPKFLLGQGRDAEVVKHLNDLATKYNRSCRITLEQLEACGTIQQANPKSRPNLVLLWIHLRGLFATNKLVLLMILLWLSHMMLGLAYPLFNVFLPSYLASRGVKFGVKSPYETWRNYALVQVSSIFGPILSGHMANFRYLGRRYTMAIGALMTMAFLFAYSQVSSQAQNIAYTCVISFTLQIYAGCLYGYTVEVIPSTHRGTGNGISVALHRLMGVISAVIATEADTETSVPCDRAEPACSQCVRARFSCPGYRDPLQLQYRDESRVVQSRVQSITSGIAGHRAPIEKAPVAKAHTIAQSPRSQLSLSITDESICFFFRYYVLDDGPDMPIHLNVSQMQVLAATSPSVKRSLSAVGLAALSNIRKSPRLMAEATEEYTLALRLANYALKEESQRRSDSTLAAPMLLAMFEVLTCSTSASLESWAQHIRGAAALIELRGAEQIREVIGMRMFTHLRVQIISSCLHWRTSVPSSIVQWSLQAMSQRSPANAKADELVELVARVSQLLSQAKTKRDLDLMHRIAFLDDCLLKWKQSLPSRWTYQTIRGPPPPTSNTKCCYPEVYHIYPDLWACNIWNFYRSARILLNQLACSSIDVAQAIRTYQTTDIVEQLAADIAASVLYALETVGSDHYLGGFIIVWPLYLATNVSVPGSALREWGINKLEEIGHQMGIGQGQYMARTLRNAISKGRLDSA